MLKCLMLYLAWLQSLVATLGSLYFSEVKNYTPCELCWYQRILMYPLVLIIAVGIVNNDKNIYKYVLPMSLLGTLTAFYHILIQNKLINNTIGSCDLANSCDRTYTGYFGFITIPVMSFTAFVIISAIMLIYKKQIKHE